MRIRDRYYFYGISDRFFMHGGGHQSYGGKGHKINNLTQNLIAPPHGGSRSFFY